MVYDTTHTIHLQTHFRFSYLKMVNFLSITTILEILSYRMSLAFTSHYNLLVNWVQREQLVQLV